MESWNLDPSGRKEDHGPEGMEWTDTSPWMDMDGRDIQSLTPGNTISGFFPVLLNNNNNGNIGLERWKEWIGRRAQNDTAHEAH